MPKTNHCEHGSPWIITSGRAGNKCEKAKDSDRGIKELREVIPESLDPGGYSRDELTARMAKLRSRGETLGTIGEKFGVTPKAVSNRIAKAK